MKRAIILYDDKFNIYCKDMKQYLDVNSSVKEEILEDVLQELKKAKEEGKEKEKVKEIVKEKIRDFIERDCERMIEEENADEMYLIDEDRNLMIIGKSEISKSVYEAISKDIEKAIEEISDKAVQKLEERNVVGALLKRAVIIPDKDADEYSKNLEAEIREKLEEELDEIVDEIIEEVEYREIDDIDDIKTIAEIEVEKRIEEFFKEEFENLLEREDADLLIFARDNIKKLDDMLIFYSAEKFAEAMMLEFASKHDVEEDIVDEAVNIVKKKMNCNKNFLRQSTQN